MTRSRGGPAFADHPPELGLVVPRGGPRRKLDCLNCHAILPRTSGRCSHGSRTVAADPGAVDQGEEAPAFRCRRTGRGRLRPTPVVPGMLADHPRQPALDPPQRPALDRRHHRHPSPGRCPRHGRPQATQTQTGDGPQPVRRSGLARIIQNEPNRAEITGHRGSIQTISISGFKSFRWSALECFPRRSACAFRMRSNPGERSHHLQPLRWKNQKTSLIPSTTDLICNNHTHAADWPSDHCGRPHTRPLKNGPARSYPGRYDTCRTRREWSGAQTQAGAGHATTRNPVFDQATDDHVGRPHRSHGRHPLRGRLARGRCSRAMSRSLADDRDGHSQSARHGRCFPRWHDGQPRPAADQATQLGGRHLPPFLPRTGAGHRFDEPVEFSGELATVLPAYEHRWRSPALHDAGRGRRQKTRQKNPVSHHKKPGVTSGFSRQT